MIEVNVWSEQPPEVAASLLPFLTENGSLTTRLIGTGRHFSVTVRTEAEGMLFPDESMLLGTSPNEHGYVREVTLSLDDIPVVAARSVTRLDCTHWRDVLTRGARSLGFTLFGELSEVEREPLHYAQLDRYHPMYAAAAEQDREPATSYPARRSRFLLSGTPLLVCETFLPALVSLLP